MRFQERPLDGIRAWARQAAPADLAAETHRRIALALDEDRVRKTQEIQGLERASAALLVQTPSGWLLSFPGIQVVSAAAFASAMGPMSAYARGKAITGRAGLFPSRYPSDRVDHADGPLVRRGHRALREAILRIADHLIRHPIQFRPLAGRWRAQGQDARHGHVQLACRFCRIADHRVAGPQVFRQPRIQGRHDILDKLQAFQRTHDTPMAQTMADLLAATAHLPRSADRDEAKPLQEELETIDAGRRRGPQRLGAMRPIVLARLGVGTLP